MTKEIPYLINDEACVALPRANSIAPTTIVDAIHKTRDVMRLFGDFDVDVFSLLGMRSLSAFVGEVFAASLLKCADPLFRKNPHQDGYPDLLLMDDEGMKLWESLSSRLREKQPFSPFETGGVEIKATCGSVPTPRQCAARGFEKPHIGEERIGVLRGYDWKAHHQETNRLLGLVWDFIERVPTITAAFYSDQLTPSDWGAIVTPKAGGGRVTSVSIMSRAGVQKMYQGWVAVIDDDRHVDFFNRHNRSTLIPR